MTDVVRPSYIIDNILPAYEIHLIGGPSGSGKTTLSFQMLSDLKAGKDIFGYTSHPVPFCYVACDRSTASTQRTMQRMGVTIEIPTISLVDMGRSGGKLNSVIEAAFKLVPDMQLLVIDAIASLVPKGKINDYDIVMDFMTAFARRCQVQKFTVLACGHTTKVKEGEDYKNPRQKFLGSVAWGATSETMIYIEPTDPTNPADPSRKVLVLLRNDPSFVLDYCFNSSGHLVPYGDVEADLSLDINLLKVPRGTELTTATMLGWGTTLGIPARTVERWIRDCVQTGKLLRSQRVKKGVFLRPTIT